MNRYRFLLFLSIVLLVYSNSWNTTWQLDDKPNILTNSRIHISELTFQQLATTLQAHPTSPGTLYRPLPCLTFGLNWYIGQDNVFGYHIVNIVIHILTAWFLFLTLHLLLRIFYKKKYPPQFFIAAALLAALFWGLAPIQTQAVTYIVQRMAAMAAMFTIISIYAYLRGKISPSPKKIWWFLLCLLSFCAALGSKENAVLLPASLLLLELAFFRHHFSKKYIISILLIGGTVFSLGFFFIRHGLDISSFHFSTLFNFLDGYDERSFTLKERLLTEPRIVLMYLSQILLPNIQRLSIEHDIILSTSFFSPWTTLPAIMAIFLVVSGSLFFLKKHPLFCFPVLFFFLNHTVESTVAPLELIFEHRNYLPSLFLFLPVGILVAHILYSAPSQSTFRRTTAILCTILFLIISGHATYTRNQAWETMESLWSDALRKAPKSSRAASYLGNYYRQFTHYQIASHYFKLSLMNAGRAASPNFIKKTALNDLGAVNYLAGNYEKAARYFNDCLELDETGEYESCLKNRTVAFMRLDMPQKALSDALKLPKDVDEYQYLVSTAAYLAEDYETSLQWIQKLIAHSFLNNDQVMYLTGVLLLKKGAYQNSLFFLQRAAKLSPSVIKYQLALAAVFHKKNKISLMQKTIHSLLKNNSLVSIKSSLKLRKKYNEIDNSSIAALKDMLSLSIQSNIFFLPENAE